MSAHIDGRLAADAGETLDAHIAQCHGCGGEWRLMSRASLVLTATGPAEPPADLAARAVQTALASATRSALAPRGDRFTESLIDRLIDRWLPVAWPAAALSAAAAAVLITLAAMHGQRAPVPGSPDPVAAVAGDPGPRPDLARAVLAMEGD